MRKLKSTRRICIDLDGTLCDTYNHEGALYEDVSPMEGAAEAVANLRAAGFRIVLYSARNMKACNNSLGHITAVQAPIIDKWCKKHNIEYDELWLGKPLADFYIDDKGITFQGDWKATVDEVIARGEVEHE